jgi:hypothetical protein
LSLIASIHPLFDQTQLAAFKKWSLSFENLINKLKERNVQFAKASVNTTAQQPSSTTLATNTPTNNQLAHSPVASNMTKSLYEPLTENSQNKLNVK